MSLKMAKALSGQEKDANAFYILYCCTHCDKKFQCKNILEQHQKTCELSDNMSWVKEEPKEMSACSVTSGLEFLAVPQPTGGLSSDTSISLGQIKTESATVEQSVSGQSTILQTQVSKSSQQTVNPPPLMLASQLGTEVRTPIKLVPVYHNATKKLTASELLRLSSKGMVSVDNSKPGTKAILSKNKPILPRSQASASSDSPVQINEYNTNSSENGLPVIERVYYTSKGISDSLGEIRMAKDAQLKSPIKKHKQICLNQNRVSQTKGMATSKPPVLNVPSPFPSVLAQRSICKSQQNLVASSKQPQQVMFQKFKLQHSQGVQNPPQNIQPISADIFQTSLGLANNPQTLLSSPSPLVQNQQALLQNNLNLIQSNLLQQSAFLIQSATNNLLQNQLVINNQAGSQLLPLLRPDHIALQTSPVGTNVLPPASSVLVPASTTTVSVATAPLSQAVCTTAPYMEGSQPQQKHQSKMALELKSVSSLPSTPTNLVTASTPRPLISQPQVLGGLNSSLPSQVPTVIPNPSGTGLILLQNNMNSPSPNINELHSLSSATLPLPVAPSLSPVLSRIVPSNNPLQQVQTRVQNGNVLLMGGQESLATVSKLGQQQAGASIAHPSPHPHTSSAAVAGNSHNQSSNIVLLPPVIGQGHVLGGIRIGNSVFSQPVTPLTSNVKPPTGPQVSVTKSDVAVTRDLPLSSVSSDSTSASSEEGHILKGDDKQTGPKQTLLCISEQKNETNSFTNLTNANTIEKSKHKDSPFLTLSFKVHGSADHYTVTQVIILPEGKLVNIAKTILNGRVSDSGPVIMTDGRLFVPISFTGPFTPKETKALPKTKWVEANKNKLNGVFEQTTLANICSPETLNKNVTSSIQTIMLPGKVVWLLLDFDCPKILWTMGSNESQVLCLPLELELPSEVVTQVNAVLTQFNLTLPKDLFAFPVSKSGKLKLVKEESTLYKTLTGSAQSDNQLPDPSSERSIEKDLPQTESVQPPISPSAQSVSTVSAPVQETDLKEQKSPCTSQHTNDARNDVTPTISSERLESTEPDRTVRGDQISTNNEVKMSEQTKEPLSLPRLTVGAEVDVIQRALKAFVRLERIPMTEDLRAQLTTYSNDIELTKKAEKRRSHVLEEQPLTLSSISISNDAGFVSAVEHYEKEGPLKTNTQGVSRPKRGRLSLKKVEGRKVDTGSRCPVGISSQNEGVSRRQEGSGLASQNSTSDEGMLQGFGRRMFSSNTSSEVESANCLETDVRRSDRLFCKPKHDYKNREHWYDSLEEELEINYWEQKRGCGTEQAEKGQTNDKAIQEIPIGQGDVGKADNDAGISLEKTEDSKNADTEMMDRESEPVSAEQFLLKRPEDYKEVVLKKANPSSENKRDLKGHILYLCMICGSFQSRSAEELVFHLKQHYSGELTCKTCQYGAAYKQELVEHEALEHTGKPLYHCELCQTPFFSRAIYQSHLRRHESSLTCSVCSMNFTSGMSLKAHLDDKHPRRYICCLCNFAFRTEKQVRSHYSSSCKSGFQCCACYVKQPSRSAIQHHVEKMHGHTAELMFCSFENCDASFMMPEELASHTAVHLTTL